MSEKQAKLLRYFVKNAPTQTSLEFAAKVKSNWPTMTAKSRGKITSWMKKVIVTTMYLSAQEKKLRITDNLNVLKGFSV